MSEDIQLISCYQKIIDNYLAAESAYTPNLEKNDFHTALSLLKEKHIKGCPSYARFIKSGGINNESKSQNAPYKQRLINALPVSIFKILNLRSTTDSQSSARVITSSGTSGSSLSKIFLDQRTSINQTKVLKRLTSEDFGSEKYKMLVLAAKPEGKSELTASDAAILGFSHMANEIYYAIKPDDVYDDRAISKFLSSESDKKIIFGFTFQAYKFLLHLLESKVTGLDNVILLHGGGWKKYQALGLSNADLGNLGMQKLGMYRIVNYYGMAEQLGSVYFECSEGYFHTSIFNDISIVNLQQEELPNGSIGFLVVRSIVPFSYPGHELLTDDTGIVYGVDKCKCGRPGKFFKVIGRLERINSRGCSDAT